MLFREKPEEPRHRKQQSLRIPVIEVGSGQEVRTDHFQAIAPRSVASQHQGRGLKGALDHRDLALVQFEVDNFPGLCYFPCKFFLDCLLKVPDRLDATVRSTEKASLWMNLAFVAIALNIFDAWITGATRRFEHDGLSPERARELALLFLCALEGAFVLARALRSTEPLHAAGASVTAALRDALPRS